jgi:hypothetical protein
VACLNHCYPIKHKLRGSSLMKSFMTSVSFSRGMEVDKDLEDGDAPPFPGEDAVMMIYDGRPLAATHRMPDSSLGTMTHRGKGCGNA